MPERDGRRYPYTAPTQKHSKGKASRSNPADKSKNFDGTTRNAMGKQQKSSMATRPAGTAVIAPGGRASRAKGYPYGQ